ncbi:DUF2249 domain-containing protein [Magnetospirillum sp. UT-4]|uniref:DUF2249 domain-containing protein n=1 Tax=Magnetospirillum sp. UT-4 TaxID=2681467 RepID=UPI00137D5717|nr:DUF2249 domain-containing protein [Magnetospirillum sp. UT-4]CAA7619438.1 conserved hypothetical protein [Magnetospirillum sp. UT-4]
MAERGDGLPTWLAQAAAVSPIDVRAGLAAGEDPLGQLMEAADKVEFGGCLVVDAPFNPSPLRRVLAARGFSSFGRRLGGGHWRVYFHLDGGLDWERDSEAEMMPEGALSWREPDGLHVDVRRLAPPLPMVAILRLIDASGPELGVLQVHHDRLPHFLVPELAERGWRIADTVEEPGEIRLRLERGA